MNFFLIKYPEKGEEKESLWGSDDCGRRVSFTFTKKYTGKPHRVQKMLFLLNIGRYLNYFSRTQCIFEKNVEQ